MADSRRHSLSVMQQLAASRGGQCLADKYINSCTKIRWRCSDGHEFDMAPNRVQQRSWCPVCARSRAGGTQRLRIEQFDEIAAEKGGKVLTRNYQNQKTDLLMECREGHQWTTKASNISAGKWCPKCTQSVSEQICRAVLETAFGTHFPKAKPKWLVNNRGNLMELDGFSKKLSLAFEYNGKQHYKTVEQFHQESDALLKRQEDDQIKIELCADHNVHLIVIPYTVDQNDLPAFLHAECLKAGQSRPLEVFNWNHSDIYRFYSQKTEEMRLLAKKKGGRLLSEKYIDANTKLEFECAQGHTWFSRPTNMYKGVWCKRCAAEVNAEKLRKYDITQVQDIAATRNGRCLSKEVSSSQSILKWECAKGHQWETKLSHIIGGHWCSKCAKAGKHAKYTIEHFQEKARAHGGECVSTEYKGITGRLKWLCKEGHEWEAPAKSVQDGRWCRKCGRKAAGAKISKYSIESMRDLALHNGGECLSTFYQNPKSMLKWRCSKGHEWESTAGNIISGSWCRRCAQTDRKGKR